MDANEDTTPHRGRSRWITVTFLQGEDADALLDLIEAEGTDAAIRHLTQWDIGDETTGAALENGYVYDTPSTAPTDRVAFDDRRDYALTYNHAFGYASLLRAHAREVSESAAVDLRGGPASLPSWFERPRTVSSRRSTVAR